MHSHTGEYITKCVKCDESTNLDYHCNMETKRIHKFKVLRSDMLAYRCELCDFVQLNKGRLEEHLRSEHDTIDSQINKNCLEFVILPWMATKIMETGIKNVLIQGKYKGKHSDIFES